MASSSASSYRGLLWLFTGAGLLCFWPIFEGARGHIPPSMGLLSGGIAVLCFMTGAYFGWKGAKLRIAEREKKADAVALIMMAATLKDREESELRAVIAKGGPAADAARLILERRKTGLRPSGAHTTSQSGNN